MLNGVALIVAAAHRVTETGNLACTDLLVNPSRTPTTRSVWPTLRVKITRRKVGMNRHLQASWASQPVGWLVKVAWQCINQGLSVWRIVSCQFDSTTLSLKTVIIRPPDVVVGALTFHRDSIFFMFFFYFCLLFSSATLQARWTELNQNWPHARKWVRFDNVCSKSGVCPPPANRGPQTHLFSTTSLFNTNLKAYILGTNHDIHNWVSALVTTRVSYIVSKFHELWSTNSLKLDHHFTHLIRKFWILLHCQASQTEISKWNSTKLCQTMDNISR